MNTFRLGRLVGVLGVSFLVFALAAYGSALLIGPLPAATATLVSPAMSASVPSPPVMPSNGASAIIAPGRLAPIASAGKLEPLPMASATKVVTALVVLDTHPLAPGDDGPAVTITDADFAYYANYAADGARTVAVIVDDTWSERELLQAMVLGSSNNHADTLAAWAFGSVDAYLIAASAWLAAHDLTGITVVDTNGLHDASVGTATDLARLTALAASEPVFSEMLADPAAALAGMPGVINTTSFLPELGVMGVSLSSTDAAGICLLFTATLSTPPVGDDAGVYSFTGAIMGEPDYDTLTADVTALMASAHGGVGSVPLLTEGDVYVTYVTAWGQTASGVVATARSELGWQTGRTPRPDITLREISTGHAGADIGRAVVTTGTNEVASPLILDGTLSDPGLGWRLMNPIPTIEALIDSRRD
ncbi:hypothetical protein [Leifsonia sp. A12D58]|uniref:hypothetical protein n=1 Tax=Leifsonia sp. A12D58 TaxID=3397674 RepID=UPI0039E0F7A4